MFTEESFRAVRDHLKPDGAAGGLQLLPRAVAGRSAREHGRGGVRAGAARPRARGARVPRRACWPGPRLATLTARAGTCPDRVTAFGQSHAPSPGADPSRAIRRSSRRRDDWPFLYLRDRQLPRHYLDRAGAGPRRLDRRRAAGRRCAGRAGAVVVAVLPARRRLHAARDEVDHPVRAVVGLDLGRRVAGDRVGADDGARRQLHRRARSRSARPWLVGARAGRAARAELPRSRSAGSRSRAAPLESLFYAVLVFSPILCAGLLFGSAIKRSTSLARDYGTNLLGAMVGGVGEYLSLVTGFRVLLFLIAACYVGALLARPRAAAWAIEPCSVPAYRRRSNGVERRCRRMACRSPTAAASRPEP